MSAKHPSVALPMDGLDRAAVIIVLLKTFGELRWEVDHVHPLRVAATVPSKGFTPGAKVEITFGEGTALATAKPAGWSPFPAHGRLAKRRDELARTFNATRAAMPPEEMARELEELERAGVMGQPPERSHADVTTAKDLLGLLVPKPGYFATPLLMIASLLVFLLMAVSGVSPMAPTVQDLIDWGGNYREGTLGGDWWRLLSCCFVHIGLFHLLFNMYALAMAGVHLEPLLGRGPMFALYALTGVAASVASLWWHENTVSAGASGAIFGLYGVFLALLLTDLLHKEVRKGLLSSIGVFVAYNLLMGMRGGVDNAAHIGGLLSGVVFGFALYPVLKRGEEGRGAWSAIALPALLMAAGGWAVVRSLPMDGVRFQQAMERYMFWEEEGLALYGLGDEEDAAAQLVVLEDRSLPAWDSAMAVLDELRGLDLGPELAHRRELLERYTLERRTNTLLVQRALLGEGGELETEIQASFARIDSLVSAFGEE